VRAEWYKERTAEDLIQSPEECQCARETKKNSENQ